jgi:preprotein translocase subunit SecD
MKQRFILLVLLFSASFFAHAESKDLPTFTIDRGQVFQAAVVLDAEGHATLRLDLISDKRTEFADFTKRYLEKQVQIVVDGKPLVQPIVRNQILGGSMDFPCSSPESALALAKTLMAK